MQKIIFLSLSLGVFVTARAQKTDWGVKGGVSISRLGFNDNTHTNAKVGLHLGILARVHASDIWAIQSELNYSLEGAKQNIGNNKVVYTLNYLNVPVLLQYQFHNGFRLEGGPQMGFLLNARTKTGNVSINNSGFESTSISVPLGVGYTATPELGFDARYVFGLSNINSDKNGAIIQSNVFQLGIFYLLSGHKHRLHH